MPVRALLANGTLPGTEIRVKEGELLRIQVENALEEPTSLHWHGLLLPAAMDGVPGISQAPIAPGQVFVYEYPIRQAGTYWYHSHVELQEQLGLSGPFIIEAKDEPLLINPGDRVQVELVNETRMAHPMHVHGHFFRLLTASGDDPLAPLKDTVAVWPRETVRFEFYADNPGKWFFHCHNLYHLETGMAREWHYVI